MRQVGLAKVQVPPLSQLPKTRERSAHLRLQIPSISNQPERTPPQSRLLAQLGAPLGCLLMRKFLRLERYWSRESPKMPQSFAVVRVLVVDDFEPFRRFISVILKTKPELQVIGEASDGLEGVQKAEDLRPDLILLDIGLPKLNGMETAKSLSRIAPEAKVLFVSQSDDPNVIAAAMSDGAKGYVWKPTAHSELLPAIEAVMRGDRFISSQVQSPPSNSQNRLHLL